MRFFTLILLFLFFLGIGHLARAEGYFAAQPDLPIAPGLIEDTAAGLTFDPGIVRILDLVAAGPAKTSDIQRFYADTLPMLGWDKTSGNTYAREGEVLQLGITPENGRTIVKIRIEPAK